MTVISDEELRAIVEKVVQRTLHGQTGRVEEVSKEIDQQVDSPPGQRSIALGADHGGYHMKEMLKSNLTKTGYHVVDCGTNSTESVDYPDFALAVAELVGQGKAWRGIIIDGAGIGSCMTANKVPGVRAAMCYDYATAVNSREHNDANVLTLGAGLIGDNLARQIVDSWLTTEFGGGRHARRVDKIIAVENKFLKTGS
jgi:ribose 5-phosphate isomerase B